MNDDDRLSRTDARLDRITRLMEQMALRHMGIRGLYRKGMHRVEEMADRMDYQDVLLESLMDSQLRTEASMRDLADTFRRYLEKHT